MAEDQVAENQFFKGEVEPAKPRRKPADDPGNEFMRQYMPQRNSAPLDWEIDKPPPRNNAPGKGLLNPYEARPETEKFGKGDAWRPPDVTTEIPKNDDEWKSWFDSLSPERKRQALKLQDFLKSEGWSGWSPPPLGKASDKSMKLWNYFMDMSAPHWQHSRPEYKNQRKEMRKKRGMSPEEADDPSDFFRQKSEMKDLPNAVAAFGGRRNEDA